MTTQSTDTWAQLYADNGYSLTPLRGKIATRKGWPSTQYEPFPEIKGNFGVVLQDDDLIIDVDPRNFEAGIDSYKALCDMISQDLCQTTFYVQTGSGGLHIYLKKPSDLLIRNSISRFPGVEFKSRGQYVVGAGGIHPDTLREYQGHGSLGTVSAAPTALLDLIERRENDIKPGIDNYVSDEQSKARFIKYLEKAPIAIQGENGDRTTFAVAATGHDFGLHPDVCFELMTIHYNTRCEPSWPLEELKRKVYNAYKYSQNPLGTMAVGATFEATGIPYQELMWDMNNDGGLKKTLRNTVNLFRYKAKGEQLNPLYGLLGYNQFTNDIVYLKQAPWQKDNHQKTWSDECAYESKVWIAANHKLEPSTPTMHEAVVVAAKDFKFHPVRDYLDSLKWDGVKRAHKWAVDYLGAHDNIYHRTVGLKMLVGAVSRVYHPGEKFDYLVVLEGKQGTGKSTALSILAAPWFADLTLDVHNKDTIEAMRGKWIIELSEMETHNRTEEKAMKAFLSRSEDRARLAYMRIAKDYPRQSIFVGTINPEEEDIGWLKDTTGNRRYWPVATGDIKLAELKLVRDQLWAEAVQLHKSGVPLYLEDRAIALQAEAEQKKRMGVDAWEDRIKLWVDRDEYVKLKNVITGQEIYTDCLSGKLPMYTRREQSRIAMIMNRLGWEKGVFYDTHTKLAIRGYKRPTIE